MVRSLKKTRTPVSKDRVLREALALADRVGLEGVSMRALGQALGVEAMTLYSHVANKDEILDGLIDLVVAEFETPSGSDWKKAIRKRCLSMHAALLRHPWAAVLLECRVTMMPGRLAHHDAVLKTLREAGFTVPQAYKAFLTLDSYVYGFTLQEVSWPFEPNERPQVVAELQPHVLVEKTPFVAEMMAYIAGPRLSRTAATRDVAYLEEFRFGLDLVLDGLERVRGKRR